MLNERMLLYMFANLSSNDTCAKYNIPKAVGFGLIGVNLFSSLLGTIGNLLVCIIVFTTKSLFSSFHYFIMSLAIADLSISLIDQPLLVVLIFYRMKSKCYTTNEDDAFRLLGNFGCVVSLLTLAIISLDRCLFITQVFRYENIMTKGKYIMISVVWMVAAVETGLRYAATQAMVSTETKVTSFVTVAGISISYLTIVVCYSVIYVQFHKQRKRLAAIAETSNQTTEPRQNVGQDARQIDSDNTDQVSEPRQDAGQNVRHNARQIDSDNTDQVSEPRQDAGQNVRDDSSQDGSGNTGQVSSSKPDTDTERQFAQTIILVVLVYTGAWAYFFYLRVAQPDKNYGALYNIARTAALSSSALNPLLYCFRNEQYRKGLKKLCLKCGCEMQDRDEYERL